MRKKLILAAAAILLRAGSALAVEPPLDPVLLQALVAGNWPAVATRIAAVINPTPALRILAGHAYLAGDRGNEALCAFASAASQEGRAEWLSWTSALVAANPRTAFLHYLQGDAFARQERWAAAQEAFDRALALAPGDPLVLNARALAAAAAGNWSAASRDLRTAASSAHPPLDIKVNQGVIAILHRADPKIAGRHFEAVLVKAPQNAIALIGRGAAAAAEHEWRAAQDFYARADAVVRCIPLALDDALLAGAAEFEDQQQEASLLAEVNPGAAIFRSSVEDAGQKTQTAIQQLTGIDARDRQIQTLQDATWRMEKVYDPLLGGVAGALDRVDRLPGLGKLTSPVLGGVSDSMREVIASNRQQATRNDDTLSQLRGQSWSFSSPGGSMPSNNQNPGGVRTRPPASALDKGNWPVVLWPVLLYHLTPAVTG